LVCHVHLAHCVRPGKLIPRSRPRADDASTEAAECGNSGAVAP
jgi:hypothetical protein